MPESQHQRLVEDLTSEGGVIMLLGAPDTGKSSFARRLLESVVAAGKQGAYIDADVGQTTVGPPTCVGLKWVRSTTDLQHLSEADDLRFVGSISPKHLVLQEVIATASLVEQARDQVDIIVIDTTGAVSGVTGQTLKFHKLELCRPTVLVALQRGSEIEPIVGMARRFFSADARIAGVLPDIAPLSPTERSAHRTRAFGRALAPPLHRWKVRPTVFAPSLPTGLDFNRLQNMLVGVHDGTGRCLGLGVLTVEGNDRLLVMTSVTDGMQGLRLASLRIDPETFETTPVNLREVMFGLDG
ncbi:MAG: Clp1/GlmU family protein [Acidimicrobiia bacterium]